MEKEDMQKERREETENKDHKKTNNYRKVIINRS